MATIGLARLTSAPCYPSYACKSRPRHNAGVATWACSLANAVVQVPMWLRHCVQVLGLSPLHWLQLDLHVTQVRPVTPGSSCTRCQMVASHDVSSPDALWLPVLVFPAGHARHMWCTTFSLGPQIMASHVVSLPDASCLPRLIFLAGHAVHEWLSTFHFHYKRWHRC